MSNEIDTRNLIDHPCFICGYPIICHIKDINEAFEQHNDSLVHRLALIGIELTKIGNHFLDNIDHLLVKISKRFKSGRHR